VAWEHRKSGATIFLDILRNVLILIATGYIVFFIWKWNWIIALIAAIPIYIVMLNLFGFLTLPLYAFTPENRLKAKALKAFENSDVEKGKALTDEFTKKFNVNAPEESRDERQV
jgi:ABC-type multidrug transport system fused ATPase/permease subunit